MTVPDWGRVLLLRIIYGHLLECGWGPGKTSFDSNHWTIWDGPRGWCALWCYGAPVWPGAPCPPGTFGY